MTDDLPVPWYVVPIQRLGELAPEIPALQEEQDFVYAGQRRKLQLEPSAVTKPRRSGGDRVHAALPAHLILLRRRVRPVPHAAVAHELAVPLGRRGVGEAPLMEGAGAPVATHELAAAVAFATEVHAAVVQVVGVRRRHRGSGGPVGSRGGRIQGALVVGAAPVARPIGQVPPHQGSRGAEDGAVVVGGRGVEHLTGAHLLGKVTGRDAGIPPPSVGGARATAGSVMMLAHGSLVMPVEPAPLGGRGCLVVAAPASQAPGAPSGRRRVAWFVSGIRLRAIRTSGLAFVLFLGFDRFPPGGNTQRRRAGSRGRQTDAPSRNRKYFHIHGAEVVAVTPVHALRDAPPLERSAHRVQLPPALGAQTAQAAHGTVIIGYAAVLPRPLLRPRVLRAETQTGGAVAVAVNVAVHAAREHGAVVLPVVADVAH
mmetsp:Transcript_57220/g.170605  ORF Transcript_57220/g.170605 Transcript_57220/m.170605 type:complete len:426 (-) Transcript_57220:202-1479(-)